MGSDTMPGEAVAAGWKRLYYRTSWHSQPFRRLACAASRSPSPVASSRPAFCLHNCLRGRAALRFHDQLRGSAIFADLAAAERMAKAGIGVFLAGEEPLVTDHANMFDGALVRNIVSMLGSCKPLSDPNLTPDHGVRCAAFLPSDIRLGASSRGGRLCLMLWQTTEAAAECNLWITY